MQQYDLAKTFSHLQKQEPIQPKSIVIRPTSEKATNVDSPAINSTLKERASLVTELEQAARDRMSEDEVFA
jgi:hypothetical protein